MRIILALVFLFQTCAALAGGENIRVEVNPPNLVFAELGKIPNGPKPTFDGFCSDRAIEPNGPNAKMINKQGWQVTSEINYGPYTFVSFAGYAKSGTSGMCSVEQTNIAIFQNDALLGVVYINSEFSNELARLELDNTGRIRVYRSGLIVLQYEITFRRNRIVIDEPSFEMACGKDIIPTIIKGPASAMNQVLHLYGWTPATAIKGNKELSSRYETASESIKTDKDTIGFLNCSGTGVGFCRRLYETAHSYLEVITAGEINPSVVGTRSHCK